VGRLGLIWDRAAVSVPPGGRLVGNEALSAGSVRVFGFLGGSGAVVCSLPLCSVFQIEKNLGLDRLSLHESVVFSHG
jgi:hypothetical protein